MNSKVILLAILATGAIFVTLMNQTTQQQTVELEAQSGNFNFWAGNYYCNAVSGCTNRNTNLVTYASTNSSMISAVSSVVRQVNSTSHLFSWDSYKGQLFRPSYPSYSCSYNMKYNYAIRCDRQY